MKTDFDAKLDELFIDLPEPPSDKGSTVGVTKVGKTMYVAGAVPYASGRIHYPGRVGIEINLDKAKLAARTAAVLAIACAWHELGGSLAKIGRVVHMDGFVACGADFKDHDKALDGASDLFGDIFGPHGKHTRTAAGVASLPGGSSVSLTVIFELK
jgi:enamine deaminase RidA (YjgF/YER057c/UK114 family)